MKKLFAAALAVMLLWGCAPAQTPAPSGTLPAAGEAAPVRSFTDDLGRTVTLEQTPVRVACLLGSYADLWMLAGGSCIAAPDDAWDDYALELPDDAVNLGGTKHLSLEAVLAADPDFILASSNTKSHLEWKDTLEAAGIPVAYFKVTGFDDYLRMLRICTELLDTPEAYALYGTAAAERIEAAAADAAQRGTSPKVLHMRMAASGLRVKNSENNVLGEMLRELGCINIADSDATLLENLSMEHILVQDPDWIFLIQQGDDTEGARKVLDQFIRENPAWQELSAVKNDRVILLDKRLYSLKPNALWAQAYEELNRLLAGQ